MCVIFVYLMTNEMDKSKRSGRDRGLLTGHETGALLELWDQMGADFFTEGKGGRETTPQGRKI